MKKLEKKIYFFLLLPFCLVEWFLGNREALKQLHFKPSRRSPLVGSTLSSGMILQEKFFQQQQHRLYSTDHSGHDFTHLDKDGKLKMVDVGDKTITKREAIATGVVLLNREILTKIRDSTIKKGDVITVARIAGIMAAKKTDQIIPLCHNISLSSVKIEIDELKEDSLRITSVARAVDRTGVEMEALTAVSVAALTIYDMCKALSKDIVIKDVRLLRKSGGKSDYYA